MSPKAEVTTSNGEPRTTKHRRKTLIARPQITELDIVNLATLRGGRCYKSTVKL